MSTYIDPATAFSIARQARAEQLRRAEQSQQPRVVPDHEAPHDGPRPRRRRHSKWRPAAFAH